MDPVSRKQWPRAYLQNPSRWVLNNVHVKNIGDLAQTMTFEFLDPETSQTLVVNMNGYQARTWLDASKLKSTRFDLQIKGRLAVFHGRGSGHGVGMCQWGAKHMGEIGFNRDQILTHYYPGFRITKI